MRQSSNHKTPTVVPGDLWPTAGNIHIDYGEAYPGPTINTNGQEGGKARTPPFSPRARKETESVHQTHRHKAHPTKSKLSTDYWNDSFLEEQANQRKRTAAEKTPEAHDFEARYAENQSFEDRSFEDRSFEDFESGDGEFDESEFDDNELYDSEFDDSEFDDSEFDDSEFDDTKFDDFSAHDLDPLSNDLSQSLFSTVEHGRENHSNRTGYNNRAQHRIKHQFEQRLNNIVGTAHSTEYLTQLVKILDGAVSRLGAANVPMHMQSALQMARSLIKRYASRGLAPLDVLEDVIEMSPQEISSVGASLGASLWTSLLVNLATRAVIEPRLSAKRADARTHRQLINPALIKKLSGAIAQSVKLLATKRQLKALPGLATSIGHISVRDGHPLSQLPQQFYRAATKVVNNPQLYQRLCAVRQPQPASQTSRLTGQPINRLTQRPTEDSAEPQRLRLNGPVEIFIRHLGEN